MRGVNMPAAVNVWGAKQRRVDLVACWALSNRESSQGGAGVHG